MRNVQGTEHITYIKERNRFQVIVWKNNRRKTLATGKTLIEALMMRDWCKANNWKKFVYRHQYIRETPAKHYELYKDFKDENGNYYRVLFGTFNTFEEAQRERDLLIKYDWDLETLCALE